MIKKLINAFRRKHPDIYALAKQYADEKGIPVSDVIAAGVSTFLGTDEQYQEELVNIIRKRNSGGMNINQLRDLVEVFRELTAAVADIMKTSQEVSHSVVRNSIVTELKETLRTYEEIKSIGEKRGGTEASIADAFLNLILSRVTGGNQIVSTLTKTAAKKSEDKKKYEVKEFEG